jgi:hypothetical protein
MIYKMEIACSHLTMAWSDTAPDTVSRQAIRLVAASAYEVSVREADDLKRSSSWRLCLRSSLHLCCFHAHWMQRTADTDSQRQGFGFGVWGLGFGTADTNSQRQQERKPTGLKTHASAESCGKSRTKTAFQIASICEEKCRGRTVGCEYL